MTDGQMEIKIKALWLLIDEVLDDLIIHGCTGSTDAFCDADHEGHQLQRSLTAISAFIERGEAKA